MNPFQFISTALLSLLVGAVVGYFIQHYRHQRYLSRLEEKSTDIISRAESKAQELQIQAKDSALEIRQQAEREISKKRANLSEEEDRLQSRRNSLELAD